jgi:hypothetical protein
MRDACADADGLPSFDRRFAKQATTIAGMTPHDSESVSFRSHAAP